MYKRSLKPLISNSFFLFGPRGVGKTSLLKEILPEGPNVYWFNLLDVVLSQRLMAHPETFVEMIPKHFGAKHWVVADEIQKLPQLLDYVHLLIEERKIKFALTGSSARKLKRGGANLLAGRALINHMHPLTSKELGDDFDLNFNLNWGSLPKVLEGRESEVKAEFLKTYVANYIHQEIKEEQIVRQLDPFVRFLEVAAQHNGSIINASKIGRDSMTDYSAVLRYFEILEDTLLGFFLDAHTQSVRKVQTTKSKFYFFDIGVKRAIEGSLGQNVRSGSYGYGQAFEHFFVLEAHRLRNYSRSTDKFSYIRTKDGIEIDLLVKRGNRELWAIEIKSSERVDEMEINRLLPLAEDLKADRFIVASREKQKRSLKGFEIWPWQDVLRELYPGG